MKRYLGLLLSLGLGIASAGCAQNAAFELLLDLPPGPADGTPLFVLVQPRNAALNPFEDGWRGDDIESFELVPGERSEDHISVISGDETVDLNLKVRFCQSPSCSGFDDDRGPERWFQFEHPFYIGARTYWDPELPIIVDVPTERDTTPTVIDRCQIQGCVDGRLSMYCRTDGRHLCE